MGRKQIQIVAETTTDGPAVITNGPVALIGRSVDVKQGYKSSSVLVSEVSTPGKALQSESLFELIAEGNSLMGELQAWLEDEIVPGEPILPRPPEPDFASILNLCAAGDVGLCTNDEGDLILPGEDQGYGQVADDAVRESAEVA